MLPSPLSRLPRSSRFSTSGHHGPQSSVFFADAPIPSSVAPHLSKTCKVPDILYILSLDILYKWRRITGPGIQRSPQNEKASRFRERLSLGGGTQARRLWVPNLLRLLLLIGHARTGRSQLLQIVLQQADLDAAAADPLGLRVLIGSDGSVAHPHQINAVDRNLVVEH